MVEMARRWALRRWRWNAAGVVVVYWVVGVGVVAKR